MPNRILKESICISSKIDRLSWFEEVLFYRLMVNCDDYGRFDGRPTVVRSRCFGLKTGITPDRVVKGLRKLEQCGLIRCYTAENELYLQLQGWENHQQIRAKKSKFPAPEDTCKQLLSDDCKCPRNPIQSESESKSETESKSESKSETETECCAAADFEEFWSAYPVHIRKDRARTAFSHVDVPLQVLLDAIRKQKRSHIWLKEGGRFIPHPDTWLRDRRWEDELPTAVPKGASGELGEAELEAIQRMMREDTHVSA